MTAEKRDEKAALRERHILQMEEEKRRMEGSQGDLLECSRLLANALRFMENKLERCSGKRCVRLFGSLVSSTTVKLDQSGRGGPEAFSGAVRSDSLEDSDRLPPPPMKKKKKKARWFWTEDLHRHFLETVEQLGGAQLATPKQIKEQMDVEGLTDDQVRSHLQGAAFFAIRLRNTGRLSVRQTAGLSFHQPGADRDNLQEE